VDISNIIILKHHTIVSLTFDCRVKGKVVQKINCKVNQTIWMCDHQDHPKIWSGLATNACIYPYQLMIVFGCMVEVSSCASESFITASFASWLLWALRGWWLDGKNRKNNKNNAMTTDMCLSICFIVKHNCYTFHLIQWMQCQ